MKYSHTSEIGNAMPKSSVQKVPPEQVHQIARRRFLELNRSEVDIKRPNDYPAAWGVVMDVASQDLIVTAIAIGDGTTSVYFSNGGGIIGAGEYKKVAEASESFLSEAQLIGDELELANDFPLPSRGNVRFHLLTDDGVQSCEATGHELQNEQHALSTLFQKGDLVIQRCNHALRLPVRDNIMQGVTILSCVAIGAIVGPFAVEDRVPGIIMGGFIGLVLGFLGSGVHLMVLRHLRKRRPTQA
jgi:hypothetical protein